MGITNILLEMKLEKSSPKEITSLFQTFFGENFTVNSNSDPLIFQQYLFNEFWLIYQAKINEFNIHGYGICESFERAISLTNIDTIWREHLQQIPLYEYKKDALLSFSKQTGVFRQLLIYELLRS